jgi:plastocyanin
MRRWVAGGSLVGGLVAVLWLPSAALAGAGCHGDPTPQRDGTGNEEVTVRMVDACFDATVTSVDPGARVTFVNDDFATHNVGGMGWGHHEDMLERDTYSATFDEPGIFPFACSYHPGMTGAIVVGDGNGAGAGWTVLNDPIDPVADTAKAAPVADAGSRSPLAFVAIGILGTALGAGISAAIPLLRRRSAAA